jgi:tetratricopeptide (TPR) repeat protein
VLAALGRRRTLPARSRRSLLTVLVLVAAGAAAWPAMSTLEIRGAGFEIRDAPFSPQPSALSMPKPISATDATPGASAADAPGARSTIRQEQGQVSVAPVSRSDPGTAAPKASPDPQAPVSRPGPRAPVSRPGPGAAPDPFQRALYHQRAGDFEQALVHYREVLRRDEMHVEAHNNLGSLYLGRNMFDEAAREFQRVIAIEPRYARAHVNLSATFYKLGRFDAAAARAREALQIDPRDPDAYVNLAVAQKASGQSSDAQGSLRRALELNPRHAIAHYNLARQYDDSSEMARAFEHYTQFLQYAGPEQESYAIDVRARLQSLQARTPR